MDNRIINILIISEDEADFKNLNSEFRQNKVMNPISLIFNGSESPELLKEKIIANRDLSIPTVILLDISLPSMHGISHLKWILDDQELKNSKVFVITSSGEVRSKIEEDHFQIAGFIDKPVSFPKFAAAIAGLKSRWMYVEES